jgi:SAM-dependent methyltransferase
MDKLTTLDYYTVSEGFVADSAASKSQYQWLGNDELFDDFYGSVFTKLTQNENLIQAEAAICMEEFTKHQPKNQLMILDAGCGIGIATCAFANLGAGHSVGIDKSPAMIRYAKGTTLPSTTLTDLQKQDVEFRTADLIGPGAAAAAEFSSACLLYFTIYYFPDKRKFFDNCMDWLMPGGYLVVHLVDREKFDPILPPGNPLYIVSPQKYAKQRITTTKVTFNDFVYNSDFKFNKDENIATFDEKFKFNDGKVRKQEQKLYMEDTQDILTIAQQCGFILQGKIDLVQCAYENQYLYILVKPS